MSADEIEMVCAGLTFGAMGVMCLCWFINPFRGRQ